MRNWRILAIACLGLALTATPALAGDGDITVASRSGLYVRTTADQASCRDSVCGGAINTEGASRADRAVKVGKRVYLTGAGNRRNRTGTTVAYMHRRPVRRTAPERPTPKASGGLATLLAKLFGLA